MYKFKEILQLALQFAEYFPAPNLERFNLTPPRKVCQSQRNEEYIDESKLKTDLCLYLVRRSHPAEFRFPFSSHFVPIKYFLLFQSAASPCFYSRPQELDLSHNQISGIEESIASRLLNIADVRLDNNPLICDKCHLGPLIGKVKLVSILLIHRTLTHFKAIRLLIHLIANNEMAFYLFGIPSSKCCDPRGHRALQLKWKLPPICFFPDDMRGTPVNDLRVQDIDSCVEIIENEDLDAASTSYNFLESGKFNTLCYALS